MTKYVFKPYSENFPPLFEAEKKRLLTALDYPANIEHVGSTAVPGLGGKGIIDIAIAVEERDLEMISKQLQGLGYEFRPNFSTPERHYFVNFLSDVEEGTRRYHIHLTYHGSHEWKDLIEFRDSLRSHPEFAAEYAEVKKRAVIESNDDGKKYRQLKKRFIERDRNVPKRIMIFGTPGSGKSTFATQLSETLALPLFHLDKYFFVQNWQERDYGEFLNLQRELVEKERWIIDGNAIQSLEMRFSHADIVLYFRFNRILCLWRIFKRLLCKNRHISDRADGCSENVRWHLIRYMWGFDNRVKGTMIELRAKYPSVQFYELHIDREVDNWLDLFITKL